MVDPRLDLFADVRQFRHRLFRGEGDKFLRLGRRDALKNEVSLQKLLPTLTATGPFRPNGLAGRLSTVRAVRRFGLASHGAVSLFLLCHTLGLLAKSVNGSNKSALVAIFRVCNTCENSSEGAYSEELELRKTNNLRVLNTARLFESLFLRQISA